MAHFVKLHQLDLNHDNSRDYELILCNLDMVTTIEPSKVHSIIHTKNNGKIRVRESLDEILKLASAQ